MSEPLPFTRENVRAVWVPRLWGFLGGLMLVGLAYLMAGGVA
jgi:hypothetical protein